MQLEMFLSFWSIVWPHQYLMILIYFCHFISSYVFGIDIGTEYTKISVTDPSKGIRAAINQNSHRLTPSYFSIWDFFNSSNPLPEHINSDRLNSYRWEFLEPAKARHFRYPTHSVKGLRNLLNSTHGLTRREILALLLRRLITTIEEQKFVPSETALVFAVEPTLQLEERVAIAETCKIANVTLFAIIESPAAAARLYAMEKRSFFNFGQKVVMFIDIGATHTWCSIYRFEPNGQKPIVNELSVSYNSKLGGDMIDEVFADFLEKKFIEQNRIEKVEILNFVKSKRMIFIEESIRAKEILSLNDVVNARIDDVYENYSLNINVTRNEFESLISFFTSSLKDIFTETLNKGKVQKNTLDSIELLGGCTRIPLVQSLLKNLSSMNKLNRTLNGDEAIAIGAGYFGAEMKDEFNFKPVKISSHVHTKVYLKHLNKTVLLFNESNRNTDKVRKSISTKSLDSCVDFTILAGEIPMLNFHLKPPQDINLTKNESVIITFAFNRFNAPFIYNISMNTGRVINVTFSKPSWMLNSTQMKDSIMFVRKMEEEENDRRKVFKIRNDYENFIIQMLKKLEKDEIFQKVTPEELQNEIKTAFKDHEKWVNSMETDRIEVHDLANRFIQLRDMTRDAEIRAELFVKRRPVYRKLGKILRKVYHALTVSWPIKKPYLPQYKLNTIWRLYNSTKEWYDERHDYVDEGTDAYELKVLPHEITNKITELENWFNETKRFKPIIKPKWEQKKKSSGTGNSKTEKIESAVAVSSEKVEESKRARISASDFDDDVNQNDIDDEEEYYNGEIESESDDDDNNNNDEDEEPKEPQIYSDRKIELNNDFIEQMNKFKNEREFNDFLDQMGQEQENQDDNRRNLNYNDL